MQAITLITQLAADFQDEDYDQITKLEWAEYLNSAQRQVALVRPDASFSIESILLVSGTKQSLPSNGLRLLDIVRNMGVDGLIPGRPVTATDQATMDLYDRNWHTKTGQTSIKAYMLDERSPKEFYVTPPVVVGTAVYVEAKMSVLPTEIADPDIDAIGLDDIYEGPIRHWMLHRAYSKETDSPGSQQQARIHWNWFFQSLGIKTQTDKMYTPSVEVKSGVQ